jgi:hypothetical protein
LEETLTTDEVEEYKLCLEWSRACGGSLRFVVFPSQRRWYLRLNQAAGGYGSGMDDGDSEVGWVLIG